MINTEDILETINMIRQENLDIRTITMGISLLDCIDSDLDKLNDNYNEIKKLDQASQNSIQTQPLHPDRQFLGKASFPLRS